MRAGDDAVRGRRACFSGSPTIRAGVRERRSMPRRSGGWRAEGRPPHHRRRTASRRLPRPPRTAWKARSARIDITAREQVIEEVGDQRPRNRRPIPHPPRIAMKTTFIPQNSPMSNREHAACHDQGCYAHFKVCCRQSHCLVPMIEAQIEGAFNAFSACSPRTCSPPPTVQ